MAGVGPQSKPGCIGIGTGGEEEGSGGSLVNETCSSKGISCKRNGATDKRNIQAGGEEEANSTEEDSTGEESCGNKAGGPDDGNEDGCDATDSAVVASGLYGEHPPFY